MNDREILNSYNDKDDFNNDEFNYDCKDLIKINIKNLWEAFNYLSDFELDDFIVSIYFNLVNLLFTQ